MPFSNFSDPRDAILAKFKTAWDAQASPPQVIYADSKDDPPTDGDVSWARVLVTHNQGAQATLSGETGNRRFRRFGVVTVQIFTPFDDGLTKADELIKLTVDAFEGETAGGGDRVEFRNVRPNEIGQDGAWHQTNVIAEFEYDEVK